MLLVNSFEQEPPNLLRISFRKTRRILPSRSDVRSQMNQIESCGVILKPSFSIHQK